MSGISNGTIPKSSRENAIPALIALLTLLTLAAALTIFLSHYESEIRSEAREQVDTLLEPHWDDFSRGFYRRLLFLERLRGLVEADLDGTNHEVSRRYPRLTAILDRQSGNSSRLCIAPGGTVDFVYPARDNEAFVGHSFLGDPRPEFRAAAAETLATGEITLAGPYAQSRGAGPSFEALGAIHGPNGFRGMVTSTIDLQSLFRSSGLDELSGRLVLAYRGANGQVFRGDPAIFQGDPVLRRLESFGRTVEVGALPLGGWNELVSRNIAPVRAFGILGILFASGMAYLFASRYCDLVRIIGLHAAEPSICRQSIEREKPAEEVLSDREAKLRLIFSAASVGIGLTIDRVFHEVNDALCRMTGYSREEMIGQMVRMLYDTDDAYEQIDNERRLQIAETGLATIETRWRTKDGTERDIVLSTTPLDINDPARGNIFTAIDITERKRAELALRESEYFLRRSQEVARVGSFYLDTRTGNWISSKTMDEVIGLDSSPKTLRGWLKIIHPEERLEFLRYWEGLIRGGNTAFDREIRITSRDGNRQRWVHGKGELQYDESGRLVKMLGTAQDITDRKRAEEALRTSQALLDKAQRLTHFGGWEMDLRNLTLNCSDEIFRILGVPPEDFPPNIPEFFKRVHPDDKPMVLEHHRETVETGRFKSYEYRIVWPDGATRWVHATGEAELNEDGVPMQIIGTLQDITDRKREQEEKERLEARLIQAQKMESIGRLAGGVAHDFNNMLSVILGCAELIKVRGVLDGPLSGYIQEIEKAANRSRDITRQLLAFSRKQIISPRLLSINDHISETRNILSRMIGEDLHLSFHQGENLWKIKLDPFQLDQILMNLAVNARDAMPDGGTLAIRTANVVIDTASLEKHYFLVPGDYVLLEVTDDGAGMDQETLTHLFEPFFTTKSPGSGTGLGLATVYGIVKQNNGFVNVYSEPGKGTCFRVYFPRSGAGQATAQTSEEIQSHDGSGTVLLVEDAEPVRELVAEILEEIGFTVLAAQTPAEALSMCERRDPPIDVLITDIVMPNMNGMELGTRAAALQPGIKILFMSGYPEDFIANRGVLRKGVNFIQKPFGMKDIADTIHRIIREDFPG